jgi:hypothetical protein
MSISQNFPDISPSLNLNFAGARKLDSRITFTRGSTGTYMDENGLIKTAGINQARFDHSYDGSDIESLGLLIEEARTNLASYSTYNVAAWSNIFPAGATITTGIDAPDGTNTAVRFSCNNTTNALLRVEFPSFTPNGTDTYTTSFYVRKISGTGNAFTDFTDGAPSANYSSQLITNQWVRVVTSGIPTATSKYFIDLFSDQNTNYVLDFWGLQVEAGSFATSYIPTSGSTATRSADFASLTGTNFSSWYNQTEGSVASTFKFYTNHPPYYDAVSVSGSGAGFMVNDVSGGLVTDCYGGNTVVTGGDNSRSKFITGVRSYNFSSNDSVIGCSGSSSITTQTGTITNPNTTSLWLGRRGNGGSTYIMNGHIRRISYYPKRLTNTQLQNLTK